MYYVPQNKTYYILQMDHDWRTEGKTMPAISPRPPTSGKCGTNRRRTLIAPGSVDHCERNDGEKLPAISPRPPTGPRCETSWYRTLIAPGFVDHCERNDGEKLPAISPRPPTRGKCGTNKRQTLIAPGSTSHSVGLSPNRIPMTNIIVMSGAQPPKKHPERTIRTPSGGRSAQTTTAPDGLEHPAKTVMKNWRVDIDPRRDTVQRDSHPWI
ncbi:uncharacterized protein LOC142149751 [Mixophyes fleayi]|uniref:uncharacterized protein LOC142149751 n=1 Tax=Mixophyes fleayi TaxID=3061075 RepID=UPI003F4D9A38